MSDPAAPAAVSHVRPTSVSGGQLFVLGLVLGLVSGALISAFLTPLLQAPTVDLRPVPATAGRTPAPGMIDERPDPSAAETPPGDAPSTETPAPDPAPAAEPPKAGVAPAASPK